LYCLWRWTRSPAGSSCEDVCVCVWGMQASTGLGRGLVHQSAHLLCPLDEESWWWLLEANRGAVRSSRWGAAGLCVLHDSRGLQAVQLSARRGSGKLRAEGPQHIQASTPRYFVPHCAFWKHGSEAIWWKICWQFFEGPTLGKTRPYSSKLFVQDIRYKIGIEILANICTNVNSVSLRATIDNCISIYIYIAPNPRKEERKKL